MTRTNYIPESRKPNFVNNRINRYERQQSHHARQLSSTKSHLIVDLSDIGSTTPSVTTHNARESVLHGHGTERHQKRPTHTTGYDAAPGDPTIPLYFPRVMGASLWNCLIPWGCVVSSGMRWSRLMPFSSVSM